MNKVLFNVKDVEKPLWEKNAGVFIKEILDNLKLENWEVSVLFCNNSYIKSLNAQYREKNEATDVLSFPLGEKSKNGRFLAGDIVVSLDALEENARFFKVSADEELRRLFIHGILHLAGYDHVTNDKEEPMLQTQEKLLLSIQRKIL